MLFLDYQNVIFRVSKCYFSDVSKMSKTIDFTLVMSFPLRAYKVYNYIIILLYIYL